MHAMIVPRLCTAVYIGAVQYKNNTNNDGGVKAMKTINQKPEISCGGTGCLGYGRQWLQYY